MDTSVEAAEQRDWLALPTGVLQHIFRLASTWQAPGSCLASRICHAWRSAAAGCSGIQLLYHVGNNPADQSLGAWMSPNSWQLEALTLCSRYSCGGSKMILEALAAAAAAAQAAGRPLQLRTLRMLWGCVDPKTAGQLVAWLPHLRCLQLSVRVAIPASDHWWGVYDDLASRRNAASDAALDHLAPLQRATQLEELYLEGLVSWPPSPLLNSVAGLLPPSLKRLSLESAYCASGDHVLSHLTQLTFLQLRDLDREAPGALTSVQLPPGLQHLEVMGIDWDPREVVEEQQVVTAGDMKNKTEEEVQQLLSRQTNLRAVRVSAAGLCDPAARAALQQLQQVSALSATMNWYDPGGAPASLLATAGSMRGLRRLHLRYNQLLPLPALDVLTQLTRLTLTAELSDDSNEQQRRAWAEVVGRMAGLRWLSVPDVLLTPGQAWLGGLQQLRVLVLRWREKGVSIHDLFGSEEGDMCDLEEYESDMPWLEGCSWEMLPPQLQVLGVSGMAAEQAADWQVRRHLLRLLGSSSRCTVVVGLDLDELCDPTLQLAGVPAALQQVLA